jgi:hypothetical protein
MTLDPFTRFLISVLPDRYRDDIAGDLLEEASTIIAPRVGSDAARRWIRVQLIKSIPATLRLHLRQTEDDEMKSFRLISAAVIALVGALQAWDSGVFSAPPAIAGIVITALALAVIGAFIAHDGVRFGIAMAVLALLFLARFTSPVRLPDLGIIGIPVFIILVIVPHFVRQSKRGQGPAGPGASA